MLSLIVLLATSHSSSITVVDTLCFLLGGSIGDEAGAVLVNVLNVEISLLAPIEIKHTRHLKPTLRQVNRVSPSSNYLANNITVSSQKEVAYSRYILRDMANCHVVNVTTLTAYES